jgi:hypothetical protein
MKKHFVAMATIAAAIMGSAKAQDLNGPVKANPNPGGIYIRGGYNLANISINNNGDVNDSKGLSTFHAGFIADIPVADILSVQTGLLLNGQGSKAYNYADNSNTSSNYVKYRFNPLYLQLPVSLALKFPISENARLFVAAGPYAEMGIGGKATTEVNVAGNTSSSSSNIKFDNDNPTTSDEEGANYDHLKRFDYGLNFGGGLEIDRFIIGVNYGLGLSKINSTSDNNSNDNNKYRTWSFGVGVRL